MSEAAGRVGIVAALAAVLVLGLAGCGDAPRRGERGRTRIGADSGADGGAEADADVGDDGGSEADAGVEMDAGGSADGGPDAASDAGAGSDGGGGTDAGSGPDGGGETDAGSGTDAGPGTDAGGPDGGMGPASCPSALPPVLSCDSGTVGADTADGSALLTAYEPCTSSTNYGGQERILVFRTDADQVVTITATRGRSSRDFDLFVLDGGDGTAMCGEMGSCLDASRNASSSDTEEVTFDAVAGRTYYVVYDLYGSGSETTDFALAVSCRSAVCGDGLVEGGEACDDGGTADGDGCSSRCEVESGYRCAGEPSTCAMIAPHGSCGSAREVTGDASFTGEEIGGGGSRPRGDGCGTSSGDLALYYAVTIPPGQRVHVATSGATFDLVLLVQEACGATGCEQRVDSSPESLWLINTSDAPVTRIVATHVYSSRVTSGTYDISFTYSALPYVVATTTASCADTSGATALGVTEDDVASSVQALPFALDYFGTPVTHYSAASNGFLQLWADATGSPASDAANDPVPSTSTPQGVVAPFWDDLAPVAGSDVYVTTTGSAGSRVLVVEWRGWTFYSTSGDRPDRLTFQVQVHEADGAIEFHYCSLDPGSSTDGRASGSSASIGLESLDGTDGVGFSHNRAGAVSSGDALRFAAP